MSRRNGHHHQRSHGVLSFFDRLFYSIGLFFHNLFRPVRHFFRGWKKASRRTDDKLQSIYDKAESTRSRKRDKRKQKRLQKREKRRARLDKYIAPVADKVSRKRRIRAEKRRKRREERLARWERRIPHVVHKPGYLPGIERARIILMFFMCIYVLGNSGTFGGLPRIICGFAPPAFFILSGYLVLRPGKDRPGQIKRAIKRSALVFVILAAVYFALNLLYYRLIGVRVASAFTSKRFWFNFLVMNVWQFDIGSSIWYVQALLYAYIIIYFMDKWKLLKFDWLIALVLIVFTVTTGELCGLIPWEWHGYTYIPGNFITRALPYILLGSLIRREKNAFLRIGSFFYVGGIVVGVLLIIVEILLLSAVEAYGYYGHLIGMGMIAFAVSMLAVKNENQKGFEILFGLSRWNINCIYYLCQPVSMLLVILLSSLNRNDLAGSRGLVILITYLICFGIAWLTAVIGRKFTGKTNNE